jgi:ketosteroid isomerase-like protein
MEKNVIILISCLIFAGCNMPPDVNVRAEAEIINKIEDHWTATIIAKDIDEIMSIIAPEAVIMNANMPALKSLPTIRKSQESWFSDTAILHETFKSAIDTIEVSTSGDLAYVRGHSQMSINTSYGIVIEPDKWITIYRKINGEWKAIVDI